MTHRPVIGITCGSSRNDAHAKAEQDRLNSAYSRAVWEAGPLAAARRTGEQLDALGEGRVDHLRQGSVHALPAPAEERKLGMCGTLGLYLPEGAEVGR